LENLSKTPPDEHPVSFSWTINTKGHTLSLHIREIHFFIIDSFCLYYVIHPFYTDTMVLSIYIYAAPPPPSCWQPLDINSMLLFHNHQPCSGIFNILICRFLIFERNSLYFQNYQPFSMNMKWKVENSWYDFLFRFPTLIRYLPCTNSVYCEYDQISKHANIQSVLGYSDKPFTSAVKTIIDRSLYMMFTLSHAIQHLGAC
jgi:hypothetical protein